ELLGRQRSLRDQQAELERQLSLQGVELDYAEAVEALAAFEERLEVRRQAYRIVTLARRNIVGKVLPSTERNMGLLLPLLTNDRYRDVVVDPETYKIKVWDELARGMKAKDIFSGGTRDQFSLALRLAFALATLPEELGTAPGFIFLDEPLSSFDHARAEALVNLLTRGLIASNFEQIFVISHSRSFDEQQFDFHLQLESGRVAASDLPALPSEAGEGRQIGLALTGLVLLRDPGPEEQRLFVVLAMICGMALSTAGQLALLGAVEAPIGTVLRAFRRAVLIGLACAGAIVLQLNSAFTLPNLAFMLLVLLIVEMIFLARRQDAS